MQTTQVSDPFDAQQQVAIFIIKLVEEEVAHTLKNVCFDIPHKKYLKTQEKLPFDVNQLYLQIKDTPHAIYHTNLLHDL